MKYRVVRNCFGFKGRKWFAGEIVEINKCDNPPHHFEPVDGQEATTTTLKENEVFDPMRPVNVAPGQIAPSRGYVSKVLAEQKLGRILTTDKVPNDRPFVPKKKPGRPKKNP